ncbi:MAG: SemiSWEET transporter [Candidatus Kapabacteria bacterium]|nr:SemiSWEET transporter [Candidatus Kapabacteria bacterium]
MESITILGLIAATLTTFAFLPQMLKAIINRHTKDISLLTYIIFVIGIILWFIYGIIKNDLPIILANIVSFIFAFTILILKIIYK